MPLLHISLNTDSDNHILSGDTCKFRVNLGHTIYPQHLKLRRAHVTATHADPTTNVAIAGGNNVALVRFDTGVASDQFTNNLGVAGLLAIPMDYTKDRAPTQTYAGLGEGFMLGDANQGWTQHDRNGIIVEVFKSDGKTHLPWTAKEGTPGTAEVQQIDLVFEFSQFDESKPTMYEFS
jgi:hypothetical protein